MATISRKSLAIIVMVTGLSGALGLAFAKVFVSMPDALLTVQEARAMYPNRHPYRWMAMTVGFWASAAMMVGGLIVLLRHRKAPPPETQR